MHIARELHIREGTPILVRTPVRQWSLCQCENTLDHIHASGHYLIVGNIPILCPHVSINYVNERGKTPLTLYMSAASCCVSALAQRECRWRHIPCRRSVLHYITSTFYPVLRPRLALSCPLYCMHDSNNHGLRCSSTLQPQRLRDRTLR